MRKNGGYGHFIFSSLVALLLAGCAAGIHEQARVSVTPPPGVRLTPLALLPVSTGEDFVSHRLDATAELEKEINGRFPGDEFIRAAESARRLNERGLAGEYAAFIRDYRDSGVLDRERLERIAAALEVAYLLQVRLGYESKQELSPDFLDDDLRADERREVRLSGEVWGAREGETVWEASVRARSTGGPLTRVRDVEEILDAGVAELVSRLPRNEEPSRSR